jgi:hypothetical protein
MRLTDYLKGIGKPIVYYPSIAKVLGVKETLFFCHIFFWSSKGEDGWIYRTTEELQNETGMTARELARVRHNLSSVGLIEEKQGRNKIYVRILADKVNEAWDRQTPMVYPPTTEVQKKREQTQEQRIVDPQNGSRNDDSCTQERRIVYPEPTNRHSSTGSPNIRTEREQKENRERCTSSPTDCLEKKKREGKKRKTEGPFFNDFKNGWLLAFKERFGFDYQFEGKDGKAIATLQRSALTAEELLQVVRTAWDHPKPFIAGASQTLPSLASQIVAIRLAVQDRQVATNPYGLPE